MRGQNVRCGELSYPVTFEVITQEQDDVLNVQAKWGVHAKAWCKIEIELGGETAPHKQTIGSNVWTLATHWNQQLATLTPKMRVRISYAGQDKLLGIRAVVNPGMANREIRITCEELS